MVVNRIRFHPYLLLGYLSHIVIYTRHFYVFFLGEKDISMFVERRQITMVLKTDMVKEPENEQVIGFMVRSGSDRWSNR